MEFTKSKQSFAEAQTLFPGGVNSPVRAFKSVGLDPLFIDRGEKEFLFDVDGNRFLDYVLSWGPLILGHAPDPVVDAIKEQVVKGTTYGASNSLENALAQSIQTFMPNLDMIRFVNSGTEATMSAIRLARGYTSRDIIVKFDGCYHGHSDSFLVNAGSGVATFGIPGSPGVPEAVANLTVSLPYNDCQAISDYWSHHGGQVAAIIVEPVAGNMGLVPASQEFLEILRQLTTETGALLIFDEVMSGFRCDLLGAQHLYGIEPDLVTLGKVIGGGLPLAAFGGSRTIMSAIAPLGLIYQAGTLSGNPLAVTAGSATLKKMDHDLFEQMAVKVKHLAQGIKSIAKQYNLNVQVPFRGTMWSVFFSNKAVKNYEDAQTCDLELFKRYYAGMLSEGIYLAPSQYETNFISSQHTDEDIETTLTAVEKVFSQISQQQVADNTTPYIQVPENITLRSFEMISEEIEQLKPNYQFASSLEADIVKRAIHTTADFDYLDNLVFSLGAAEKIQQVILEGGHLITDTNMGLSGINKKFLQELGVTYSCFVNDPEAFRRAEEKGITRSMAAIEIAAELPGKKIFVIGNAPTAIFRIMELVAAGTLEVDAVVGVPVGFVGAAESKWDLHESSIPSIVALGRKGGSNLAAAIINAIQYNIKGIIHQK